MNEELKKVKKEIVNLLYHYYEHGERNDTIAPEHDADMIIKMVEQKLSEAEKKARMDENDRWISLLKEAYNKSGSFVAAGVSIPDFELRNKELKGE